MRPIVAFFFVTSLVLGCVSPREPVPDPGPDPKTLHKQIAPTISLGEERQAVLRKLQPVFDATLTDRTISPTAFVMADGRKVEIYYARSRWIEVCMLIA